MWSHVADYNIIIIANWLSHVLTESSVHIFSEEPETDSFTLLVVNDVYKFAKNNVFRSGINVAGTNLT